jgi:hypothetical protein
MNKKNKKTLFIYALALLVITFFGPTIHSYVMPNVNVYEVQTGTLPIEFESEGVIEATNIFEYYAPEGLVVEELLVTPGMIISKGRDLITFNNQKVLDELTDLKIQMGYKKLALDEAKKNRNGIQVKASMTDLSFELKKIRNELEVQEQLFAQGVVQKSVVDQLKNEVLQMQVQLDALESQRSLTSSQDSDKVALYELELKQLSQKYDVLSIYSEQAVIKAQTTGKITEVLVNKRQRVGDNTILLKQIDEQGGGKLQLVVHENMIKHFSLGDIVHVTSEEKYARARIVSLTQKESSDYIEVAVELLENTIAIGSTCKVEFSKSINTVGELIKRSALYDNNGTYYVYVMEENDGILGKQHIVKRREVEVNAIGPEYASVKTGIKLEEQVVVSTDRTLTDGMRVNKSEN